MPQPDTDEVEDILARQSPNVGSMFMVGEDDAPGAQSAAPPPRAPILAPGVPRSSSGVPLPPPPPNIQWMGAQPPAPSGDIYSQVKDLPFDQAAAAVSTALKFQAMRGYQRDLQSGMAPADALAKWAPTMFKNETAITRAVQRPEPYKFVPGGANEPPRFESRGQRPVLVPPGSLPQNIGPLQAQSVLDPKTKEAIPGFMAVPAAGGRGMTVHLTHPPAQLSPSAAAALLSKLDDLEEQFPGTKTNLGPALMEQIRSVVTPPKSSTSTGNTVIRRTKDGRRAVFDAETKKFLRYAD